MCVLSERETERTKKEEGGGGCLLLCFLVNGEGGGEFFRICVHLCVCLFFVLVMLLYLS